MSEVSTPTSAEILTTFPVTSVTLHEDRAFVVRKNSLSLPAGRHKVTIPNVTPVLVDKSLIVKSGNVVVEINDAQVIRKRIFEDAAPIEELSKLRAEKNQIRDEIKDLSAEKSRINSSLEMLSETLSLTLSEFTNDTAWGISRLSDWHAGVATIETETLALVDKLQQIDDSIRNKTKVLNRLKSRLQFLEKSPDAHLSTQIVIELVAGEDCTIDLEIGYQVPGACWRPAYTATLAADGKTCSVKAFAHVWQNTGEAWEDVQLKFSTARPSLGVKPPELQSEYIRTQRKPDHLVVETREQEIQTTGDDVANKSEDILGIDDGGEVRNFMAKHKTSIASDGYTAQVTLFTFTSPAETDLVIMAEKATAAILRCQLENASNFPMLAGPVQLIKGGGPIGKTTVLYVAAGQKFKLGFGTESDIRIVREVNDWEEESSVFNRQITQHNSVNLYISNLANRDQSLTIIERIPVSEVEKVQIKIDSDKTTDKAPADNEGFITWKKTMPAYDRLTVSLAYEMNRHKSVKGL